MLSFCSIYDGLYSFFLIVFFRIYSQKYTKLKYLYAIVFCTQMFIILIICALSKNSIITKKLPATYKHSGTRLIDHTFYWPGNWYWRTANVYRDLQGLYREIRVQGFQIYGDCMFLAIPVILKSPRSDFHCNIWREFDFTGILWGYPTLDVRKSCINYGETMW